MKTANEGDQTAEAGRAPAALAFLGPFLVVMIVFKAWPLLYAFYLSFHWYDLFSPPRPVGLANYAYLLEQADFWIASRTRPSTPSSW